MTPFDLYSIISVTLLQCTWSYIINKTKRFLQIALEFGVFYNITISVDLDCGNNISMEFKCFLKSDTLCSDIELQTCKSSNCNLKAIK